MKNTTALVALLVLSGAAHAGGIDRSGQSITALFEQGRYVEFSYGVVSPDTSGTASSIPVAGFNGAQSGDMTNSFLQFGAAYKADINDQWSYALIYDQPYGADVTYAAGTGYFASGSTAVFDSHSLTGLLRYRMENNFSVHAGLRVQTVESSAAVPFVSGYSVDGDRDTGVGYVLGFAYEKPEIALRVSLTYSSAIDHEQEATESSVALGAGNVSTTEFETPQSVNLEFQTGIAADTLLFGGLRWVDWTATRIAPDNYQTLTQGGSLVSYEDDVYTWTIGIGRRLNENWSIAASASYEKSNDTLMKNLGPTDGQKSLALAATYTKDNMKITTGIRYINIGDADTVAGTVAPAGLFRDNDAVALGVKVGYTF